MLKIYKSMSRVAGSRDERQSEDQETAAYEKVYDVAEYWSLQNDTFRLLHSTAEVYSGECKINRFRTDKKG